MLKKTATLLVILLIFTGLCLAQTRTVETAGRLCNQIFRNLCVSFIAQKHNLLVEYSSFNTIKTLGIDLFVGTNNYPNTISLNDDNFFDILNSDHLSSNLDPNQSFFQTKEISNFLIKYLHQEHIRQRIMDVNPFNNRYNNNNDCFIHVRLTDTEKWNPGLQYYLKALSLFSHDNLYISSDDLNHKIIQGILQKYPHATLLYYDEVDTIKFGSTCKNIILSHGSFSSIIGYLSFFSDVYYKKYEEGKIWYGDTFSIPNWKMIE